MGLDELKFIREARTTQKEKLQEIPALPDIKEYY